VPVTARLNEKIIFGSAHERRVRLDLSSICVDSVNKLAYILLVMLDF